MAARRGNQQASFQARWDQPLIGIPAIEDGQRVIRYSVDEETSESTASANEHHGLLSVIGAWSDLDWDEMSDALDRIRHETPPTPPVDRSDL